MVSTPFDQVRKSLFNRYAWLTSVPQEITRSVLEIEQSIIIYTAVISFLTDVISTVFNQHLLRLKRQ